jgi:hypothetical protein
MASPYAGVMHVHNRYARPIQGYGALDPQALFAVAFDTLEVRSKLWDGPVTVNLRDSSPGAGGALMNQLQLSLRFSGRAGEWNIAPNGVAAGADESLQTAGPALGVGIAAALVGVWLLGSAMFK